MTQAAKTQAIAISAGTYQTKSTRAWTTKAARLAAIAAAHTLAREGTDALMPRGAPRRANDDARQQQCETDDAGFEQNLQIAVFGVGGLSAVEEGNLGVLGIDFAEAPHAGSQQKVMGGGLGGVCPNGPPTGAGVEPLQGGGREVFQPIADAVEAEDRQRETDQHAGAGQCGDESAPQRACTVADHRADHRGEKHGGDSPARKREQTGEQDDSQRQPEEADGRIGPARPSARPPHGVLQPPDQRPDAQSQAVGEVVAIGEASRGPVARVGEGVLVEPEELPVGGQALHDAERGH